MLRMQQQFPVLLKKKGRVTISDILKDAAYNFFLKNYRQYLRNFYCKEASELYQGVNVIQYKKNYTDVFIEFKYEIIILKFIASKRIYR